ncbi:MAG TPA: carbohydrate-binding protein, partial [Terriglobales bacterium]
YTVNVANSSTYTPTVRVASNGQGGAFHIEVDGSNVTGAMTVPNTGGWQSWTTLTGLAVNLTAGQHVMRLVMDSNGATGSVGNFHWLAFN